MNNVMNQALVITPSRESWGWKKNNGKWIPKWTSNPIIWQACRALVSCSCKKPAEVIAHAGILKCPVPYFALTGMAYLAMNQENKTNIQSLR